MTAPRVPPNSDRYQPSPKQAKRESSTLAIAITVLCLSVIYSAYMGLWRTGRWLAGNQNVSQVAESTAILSGSMAPTLNGPAWQMVCGECAYHFHVDVTGSVDRAPEDACCPNCGNQDEATPLAAKPIEQRVRLLAIDSDATIDRGLIVAAMETGTDRPVLKRVMGLPGEKIAICNGDVYANGRMCRRALQSRSIEPAPAVLVHDNAHRPASGSRWQIRNSNAVEGITWLEYCHSPALPLPFRRGQSLPIKDNYGFNQDVSRSLHDVRDVWIEFKWSMAPTDSLYLEHRNSLHLFRCSLVASTGAWVLEIDGKERAVSPYDKNGGEFRVLWGVLDGQIELVVEGTVVIREPIDDDLLPTEADEFVGNDRPFAIGFQREQISDLRIWRDIYYTQPSGNAATQNSIWISRRLGEDEYLLLGDNSPISMDARQSEAGYVKREKIIGAVDR